MTSKAAFSANQFAAQGQIGAIHGFLARDNSGLYDVAGKDQMTAGETTGAAPVSTVDNTFQRIASATRTGWSLAYDADLWAAYNDISFQLLTDPGQRNRIAQLRCPLLLYRRDKGQQDRAV